MSRQTKAARRNATAGNDKAAKTRGNSLWKTEWLKRLSGKHATIIHYGKDSSHEELVLKFAQCVGVALVAR